jgi:Cu(I)/Ag(I) efflux system membrane protein CusA/SilA
VPLAQLARIEIHKGPAMIKSENAAPTSWVYVDIAGIDVGTYVKNAQRAVEQQVKLPPGYSLVWSGQYEYMEAARKRLEVAVPLAAVTIILLLYLATSSWLRVGIVLLAVPFSLIGAAWLTYLLDYNFSLAVLVGIIALAGLDAETGLVMLLYLDNSYDRFRAEGRMRNEADLWHAVHDGAVQRIRPKLMTVLTTFTGLLPLLWAVGAGADTMRRLAAPMIGGLATSFIMELLVYPVIFYQAKRVTLSREQHRSGTRDQGETTPV